MAFLRKQGAGDLEQLKAAANQTNALVHQVEQADPWVQEQFGVTGMGEGVVMCPVTQESEQGSVEREQVTHWMFKAKGEKHQVVMQKKPVQIDPETAKDIQAFVELVVTPTRLAQALNETCEHPPEIKKMGAFLKWLMSDIHKEVQVELEASGLEWKRVVKPITAKARSWFKQQIEGDLRRSAP